MLLLARMRGGDAAAVAALAHTLKGSAASIGAGGVVRCGRGGRAGGRCHGERDLAIGRLAAAIDEARAAIAGMLRRTLKRRLARPGE